MSIRSTGAVRLWEEAEMNMPKPDEKPFAVAKLLVWEAWRQVKANKGAPGVDGQALDEFEAELADNLYKIWNRMSSGSYFPPPVRAVEVPKPHSPGTRVLGVPTIADRVAQTAAAMFLEPLVEPRFHPDSHGYRPSKSAHDAVAVCRQRCWKYDWVIDLDVQKFFDTVPWELVARAVEAVTDCRWVLLYVKRWLEARLQRPGWHACAARQGNPARIGNFAGPGEPVHALRVRYVDGPGVPGLPVRALRRRRCAENAEGGSM
jgi:RNA-directed DNA polymerase